MNSRHCTPVSNLIKLHIRLNLMKFIKLLLMSCLANMVHHVPSLAMRMHIGSELSLCSVLVTINHMATKGAQSLFNPGLSNPGLSLCLKCGQS